MHLPPRCNCFYQYVERNWRRARRRRKSGHGAPFQVSKIGQILDKSLDRKTLHKTDWTKSLWGFPTGVMIIALNIIQSAREGSARCER